MFHDFGALVGNKGEPWPEIRGSELGSILGPPPAKVPRDPRGPKRAHLGSIWNPFGVHVDGLTATEGSWASLGRSECDQPFVLSNLVQHGKKRSMKEARFSKITDTFFADFCSQSPPCHMKDAWGVLGWSPSCAGLLEGS